MTGGANSKLGKVVLVFCGGGVRAIFSSAAVIPFIRLFEKWGIGISRIIVVSAGVFPGFQVSHYLALKKAGLEEDLERLMINPWLDRIKSSSDIYEPKIPKTTVANFRKLFNQLMADIKEARVRQGTRRIIKLIKLLAWRVPQDIIRIVKLLIAEREGIKGIFFTPGFFSNRPLIENVFRHFDMELIVNADIPVDIVCTRLEGNARHIVTSHDFKEDPELFRKFAIATICHPPFFSYEIINGVKYNDGGVVSPVPVKEAIDAGGDTIIVFYNNEEKEAEEKHYSLLADLQQYIPADLKLMIRFAGISHQYFQTTQLAWARLYDPQNNIIVSPSSLPPSVLLLDFAPGDLEKIAEEGIRRGEEEAEKLEKRFSPT